MTKVELLKSEFHYFSVLCYGYHNANDTFYVFGYAESESSGHPALSLKVLPENARYKMAAVKTDFWESTLVMVIIL